MKKILFTAALAMLCIPALSQTYKFAHISAEEVIQLMPEMDTVRTKMAAMAKENQDVLKSMYDEYQSKIQTFQQKEKDWTEAVRTSKAKEISDLEARIQETRETIAQDMQEIQNKLQAPVMEKFNKTVEKIAKEGGYIYVFYANSVVYKDDAQSVDITPAARKALNIPAGRTLESLYKELQAQADAEQAAQAK